MKLLRRVLVAMVLALFLSLLLDLTGAPLWLRVIGFAAGLVVIIRYLGVSPALKDAWREGVARGRERD